MCGTYVHFIKSIDTITNYYLVEGLSNFSQITTILKHTGNTWTKYSTFTAELQIVRLREIIPSGSIELWRTSKYM